MINTNSKDYKEGYQTGLTWHDNYRPGGPWVMHPSPSDKTDRIKLCEETLQANRDYLAGFDQAIKERGLKV